MIAPDKDSAVEAAVARLRELAGPQAVEIIVIPGEAPKAQRRVEGLRRAQADRVAVLNENYGVDADWLQAATAAQEDDVVVGTVAPPADGSFLGLCEYLWEYSHLPDSVESRRDATLAPAGNVIYRKAAVDPDVLEASSSELEYHGRMFDAGLRFRYSPELKASFSASPLEVFLKDRARWSREWARAHPQGLFGGLARLTLPLFLPARFGRNIARKPRYWAAALAGLPLFVLFALVQTFAELSVFLGRR